MFRFFALPVDILDHELFRAFVSQKKLLVEFPCDVIDGFLSAQDPLSDRLTDFADEAFHVKVFEDRTDDSVREQVGSGQGKHEARGNSRDCLIEVGCILERSER